MFNLMILFSTHYGRFVLYLHSCCSREKETSFTMQIEIRQE